MLPPSYKDREFIATGFSQGFRIGYKGNDSSVFSTNSRSILDNPEAAREKIEAERMLGRIKGPFTKPPFRKFKACPLALRVKTNGKYRLLHNLSYPYNNDSVNLCIGKEDYEVNYASIEDASKMVLKMPGCYAGKMDIADAFRLIPIHREDQHLLGFKFEGKYYYDSCLPMGCSSACQIFQRFSDALIHILKINYGVRKVVKYLDDFLFLAATKEECQSAMNCFSHLCNRIGVPLATHKTEGPVTKLTFLGYELDTRLMQIAIPSEKLAGYRESIQAMIASESATLREIKSLIGKLVFVTNVITCGKIFLRRLINMTIGKTHPASKLRITDNVREDLLVWLLFFKGYNGKSIICNRKIDSSESLHMYTDSCKTGFAGCFQRKFIMGTFPEHWKAFDIQFLELYPIYLLLAMFAQQLENSEITFHCDNLPIVSMINAQTAKNVRVMTLLRKMILIMLNYNISFSSIHIEGKKNTLCDSLSRSQIPRSLLRLHRMESLPTPVPSFLQPQNYKT